LNKFGTVIHCN